ncbi:DMT family transporter [Streptomyces sulphureus]|uniref:DMT family transporter n=1 Tax=Streptomyces sulphureus TaxID=47758 RepID=UPI00036D9A62|nr:DMT family transporter [Streptomyces sulphureus]
MWEVVSVAFAVLAALGNAVASVLQRLGAAPKPSTRRALDWARHLLRDRVWLAGACVLALSGASQAAALATGRLAVVQPVMTTELPFTLVVGSLLFRSRPDRRTWLAFAAMTAGLAALLWMVRPSHGVPSVPGERWLIVGAGACVAIAVLSAVATQLPSAPKAAVLGSATAVAFALTAALMKDATGRINDGWGALFTAWQTYTVAAVGLFGFLMLQLTFRAGTLVASQPALTLGDAFLSVVLGALLFEERLTLGVWVLPEIAALALISYGSFQLARAPAVAGHTREETW